MEKKKKRKPKKIRYETQRGTKIIRNRKNKHRKRQKESEKKNERGEKRK